MTTEEYMEAKERESFTAENEGIAHGESVQGQLTGTDADRFIGLKPATHQDTRTPSEVVMEARSMIALAENALEDIGEVLTRCATALVSARRELRTLSEKQATADDVLMKANAQISAGLPKYPKMLYGLDGRTFIAATKEIHAKIEDYATAWPTTPNKGWFETPKQRDEYLDSLTYGVVREVQANAPVPEPNPMEAEAKRRLLQYGVVPLDGQVGVDIDG